MLIEVYIKGQIITIPISKKVNLTMKKMKMCQIFEKSKQ